MTEKQEQIFEREFGAGTTWGQDFKDAFVLSEPISDYARRKYAQVTTTSDPDFSPYENDYLKGYEQYWADFHGVDSQAEADAIKRTIDLNTVRRQRQSQSDRWFPQLLGTIADPVNAGLMLVPGGQKAGLVRTFGKAALRFGSAETAVEFGLRSSDPTRTNAEVASTIGGAALLGGVFHSALSKAPRMRLPDRDRLNNLAAYAEREVADMAPNPARFEINQNEEVMQRIRTSGYDGHVPIYYDHASPTIGRYSDPDMAKVEFLEAWEHAMKMGIIDTEDDLFKAMTKKAKGSQIKDGKLVRKGAAGAKNDAVFDLVSKRIMAGESPARVLGVLRELDANPKVQDFLKKVDDKIGFGNYRRAGAAFTPYIRMNPKKIDNMWEQYQRFGQLPTKFAYEQNIPGLLSLKELGIEGFATKQDMMEWVLRHELWHHPTIKESGWKPGQKWNRDHWVKSENDANMAAARDYLEYRNRDQGQVKVQYRSALMRMADNAAGGRLSGAQGKIADWAERHIVNSPLYRAVHEDKSGVYTDLLMLMVGGDEITDLASRAGRNVGTSVTSAGDQWAGQALQMHKMVRKQFDQMKGDGESPEIGYVHVNSMLTKRHEYAQFSEEVVKTLITGAKHNNRYVNAAVAEVRAFNQNVQAELKRAGMLRMQNKPEMEATLKLIDAEIDRVKDHINTKADADHINRLRARHAQLQDEIEVADIYKDAEHEDFWNRQFDTTAIEAHKDFFIDRLTEAYLKHPKVYIRSKGWVEANANSARNRATTTVNRILGHEEDTPDFASMGPGELRQRLIPMKNSELIDVILPGGQKVDFILTDLEQVTMKYARRTGRQLEYAKRMRGNAWETADEVYDRQLRAAREQAKAKGVSDKIINRLEADALYTKDAVTFRHIKDPDRYDRHLVAGVKNTMHIGTMAASGITALNETANLVFRHGIRNTVKTITKMHAGNMGKARQANIDEMTRAGALMDIANGTINLKYGDTPVDPTIAPKWARALQGTTSAMFIVNGMAPISMKLKSIVGFQTTDRVLGYLADSAGIVKRKPNKVDDDFMTTVGLSPNLRKRITNMIEENKDDMYDPETGVWMAATEQWSDQGAAEAFRVMLKNEAENMIVVPTLATQSLLSQGVVHIPVGRSRVFDRIARSRGWVKDGSAWRMENPALTLPFMYLSWALSATGLITAKLARNEYASPVGFIVSSLAAAYVVEDLRDYTKGSKTDFMDMDAKLGRALVKSNLWTFPGELVDRSTTFATAVGRDSGMGEDFDLRLPMFQWMDVGSAPREAINQLGGVVPDKVLAAFDDTDGLKRMLPFNQILPVRATIDAIFEAIGAQPDE